MGAGLKSLTEAVSVAMATLIWKARKEMDTLGFIFEKKPQVKNTRSKYNDNLCQPVPGYPELTANKMAQVWNNMNLSNAKSLACTIYRASALKWYQKNLKISISLIILQISYNLQIQKRMVSAETIRENTVSGSTWKFLDLPVRSGSYLGGYS